MILGSDPEVRNEMKNTLIVTGGTIELDFMKQYLAVHKFNCVIAVDGGLDTIARLNMVPSYIVGDFDTVSPDVLACYRSNPNIKFVQFQPEKDFTDTQSAIKLAIEIGSFSITIFGGLGTRFDHTLANVQMLHMPLEYGIDAVIVNVHNRIRLLGVKRKEIELEKNDYQYVSILPMSEQVTGLTLEGMKYPLNNYNMTVAKDCSMGVSNEIVGEKAIVKLKSGKIILIESRD